MISMSKVHNKILLEKPRDDRSLGRERTASCQLGYVLSAKELGNVN